ncbi:Hsp70 family protein [Geitlerinema sp. PCC 9228]|uniref:Hsp70 family protein n=1 Tax=Geitlerinema sp. PCC 9228 TaxID=111611 RepID=UPI000B010329|nr:Hsp70 family protein [Geitlerinema sp. PCC 9228]
MSYSIGLDFGTTNSIISYLDKGELTTYKYGSPGTEQEYIPSFIAYNEDDIEIGKAAKRTKSKKPNIESYGNFKMQLPEKELKSNGHKDPIQVTKDYLQQILIDDIHSFQQQWGEIAGLVVSVPEIWQRDISNLGRERLQKILRQDLGLPLQQLVSEPVAAAAYYAWQVTSGTLQPFTGNLLVCDIGGGTFDISLCRLSGDKVRVLYFDGEGNKGLEFAGVAFDRRCVQIAYKTQHGEAIDESSGEFISLLSEFEDEKILNHKSTQKQFKNYLDCPEEMGEKEVYTFGRNGEYQLNLNQLWEAFSPIREGIEKAMNRVKTWSQENGETIDRVLPVGGFSQFPFVKYAIAQSLGLQEGDSRMDSQFNFTSNAYAIAYGACLIANGYIDPEEKYVHTVGIVVTREGENSESLSAETVTPEYLTLIPGNTSLSELSEPQFHQQPLVAFEPSFTIPIWIDPLSRGKRRQMNTPDRITLPNYSQQARYWVGMRVNRSQVAYLVIEEVRSQKRVEYELGNIIGEMLPGFVLPKEENS